MVSNIRQFTIQAEEDKLALEKLVEEISEEVSNIKSDGEIVTDNAKIVSEMATTSAEFSGDGERAVSDSIEGVERIKRQIEDVAEKILELSSQTQAIGNIISTVDDIAKQSKFLAFNASIEASKVGEYGKGFAIVANEIKNLSEESKEATKKISEILNEIQGLTNTSVMLAEDATKLADAGYQLSSTAGETINKLTLSIQNSSEAAFQITSSALEQQMRLEALVGTLQAAVSSR
jgi:methyl-accepting chemotaxis protein